MMEIAEPMEEITLPAGEVVHYNGIPFRLATNTSVWGRSDNYEIARSWESLSAPRFVAGRDQTGSR